MKFVVLFTNVFPELSTAVVDDASWFVIASGPNARTKTTDAAGAGRLPRKHVPSSNVLDN